MNRGLQLLVPIIINGENKMHKIEILGTGCAKCDKLEELAKQAAGELGIGYEFSKVWEGKKILEYGVMVTPALVVNGVVKSAGKLPSLAEIKKFLLEESVETGQSNGCAGCRGCS